MWEDGGRERGSKGVRERVGRGERDTLRERKV